MVIVEFPHYLPHNCPPETAQPASGRVYYFVNNDPPTPDDFRSKRQKNPTLRFEEDEIECQAYGISVYTEIKDLAKVRPRYPNMRHLKSGVGNLIPNLGVIQPEVKVFFVNSPDEISIVACDRIDGDWLPPVGENLKVDSPNPSVVLA